VAFLESQAQFPSPGEKQEACSETFSENSPFFNRGGEEVRFSILREWALRHSRRGWHATILRPPRMGGKRCDNAYCIIVHVAGNLVVIFLSLFIVSQVRSPNLQVESSGVKWS
jgi:hypothetical protein